MKFKGYLTILIMLLVSLSVSYANTYCPQPSCSNIFWTSTYIGGASASFTPAYTTATAWSSCSLENSIFDAVGGDLNKDGLNEYVLTPSTTKISVYNTYCALVGSITSPNLIVSPPILNDHNFDGNFEIMVLTNSTLDSYNGTNLALLKSYSYLATMGGQLENMGCDDYYCFAKNATANSTAIIRLLCDYSVCYADFNITVYSKIMPQKGASGLDMPTNNALSVYTDHTNSKSMAGAWCYVGANPNQLTCTRQDSTGAVFHYTLGSASFAITSTERIVSFFAKVGFSKEFFLTGFLTKAAGVESDSEVYDENNNFLLNTSAFICNSASCTGDNKYSNWMIGNFDKTSDTQACIITISNRTICFVDGYYGDPQYNYTTSPYPVNSSALIFMGDWNVSEPYMGFATSEGIYYASPDDVGYIGSNYTVIRTGLKNYYATSSARTSPVISMLNVPTSSVTPVYHFVGTPTILYVDSSVSKMLKQGVAGSCNNGVCDAGELFSCPSDCSLITPTYPVVCTFDAQCPPAYPKCVNGSCISGYSGIFCVDSSSCPINASFCFQGVCINGVSGGTIGTPGNTTPNTNIPIGVQIDNMINTLFQGSSLLRFIVGLVLLLVCTFEFNTQFNPGFKSQAAFLVIFSVFLILFTFINLLNKWIVYGIILTAFSLAIIFFILKFKPSEG